MVECKGDKFCEQLYLMAMPYSFHFMVTFAYIEKFLCLVLPSRNGSIMVTLVTVVKLVQKKI